MSEFDKPSECMNGCGPMVYFDAKSSVGHPTTDNLAMMKAITAPLNEYKRLKRLITSKEIRLVSKS